MKKLILIICIVFLITSCITQKTIIENYTEECIQEDFIVKKYYDLYEIDIKTTKTSTITMCNKGCHHEIYCGSDSMAPTFTCNDKIFGYKPNSKEIEIGDIIFFKNPSGNLIHRIIGFENDTYITQGDNNEFVDEYRPSFGDIFIKIGRIEYR